MDRRVFIADARRITGLHSVTIWRKCKDPASGFPSPVFIGERRSWLESELLAWVAAQAARPPEARRGARNLMSGEAKP
jgi:predicted DNA-binding transcriptional regulator AlpA